MISQNCNITLSMRWTLRQSGDRKAQRPKQTKVEKQPWYFYQHQESKKHQIFYIKWVKLSWHQFKCTHNSFWKLCTEPLSAATRFFFLFVQPFLSLTASEKAETLLQNTILYERAACPGARRQHYEREHGPWLFSWGPGQSRELK